MVDVTRGSDDEMFRCHQCCVIRASRPSRPTGFQRMRVCGQDSRSTEQAGMPRLRFVGTRITDRFDHEIILLRENCAEIKFEAVVGDVTDERRR